MNHLAPTLRQPRVSERRVASAGACSALFRTAAGAAKATGLRAIGLRIGLQRLL